MTIDTLKIFTQSFYIDTYLITNDTNANICIYNKNAN